ncbi:MAG TPA: hypothetical protein VNZ06_01780 [Steroidobacteraceae bacterium]|nr:hypothetical protein [Steroidobacteraceae bacterium]
MKLPVAAGATVNEPFVGCEPLKFPPIPLDVLAVQDVASTERQDRVSL